MRPSTPRRPLALLTLALAATLVLLASAHAQETTQGEAPLSLIADDTTGTVRAGETIELTWHVVNNDPQRGYVLVAEPNLPSESNWAVTVVPEQTEVASGDTATFSVLLEAPERPVPRQLDFRFTVVAVNETVIRLSDVATIDTVGVEQILGTWDNPLPPPLDNMWGAFLLNVGAWLGISLVVMWLIDPTLKAFTRRTKSDMDDHIIQILRVPVFAILFTFGIKQSLEVFPLPGWAFTLLDRVWMIVFVIALLYVSYRVWQEIVLLIGRRMAAKTETQLDDRLLPVFDKLGGLIIIVIGIFYLIDSFGIDMTIFAAGGVLGAMVIAFAAQDTLSNFFSGVHLLVDQPFKEGDDIILDTGEVTTVTKIGLRSTHLYHVANHETIIVPNNQLATNRIVNLLRPDRKYKVRVDVGVAYGTDVQKVLDILLDIAANHPLALNDPDHRPFARFQNFGASSLDFSVHLWIEDVYTRFAVASDIRQMIDRRFEAEGIEIPFPQHVIWYGREEQERAMREKKNGGGGAPAQAMQVHHSKERAMQEQASASETGGDSGGEGGDATV